MGDGGKRDWEAAEENGWRHRWGGFPGAGAHTGGGDFFFDAYLAILIEHTLRIYDLFF